jgi:peptide/nickel transport system permease protein
MRHLLRRVLFYLVALWASATMNFLIPRLMPGDPALAYVAKMQGQNGISAQTLQNIRIQFGLSDDPLWIQYFRYLNNLLHGNLGISLYQYPTPVTQILAYDLKWTVGLVGLAAIISFILGTLLGVVVAWRRDGWLDNILPPLLTFFSAVPYFWMALGLVYLFGFVLNLFPIGGGYDTLTDLTVGWNMDFILSVLQHGILPAITIVIGSISGWVLGMRNTMLTTLSEDYVLMAQAKGLSEQRVMLAYAARNAILPSITGFAMSLGFVVGGALLTEMVFSYPGIGFDLFNAVTNLDYSLIQGTFLVIALTMLAANFLADVVYTFLDPRVRQERG